MPFLRCRQQSFCGDSIRNVSNLSNTMRSRGEGSTLISLKERVALVTGLTKMKAVNARSFEVNVLKSILPVVVVIWGVG